MVSLDAAIAGEVSIAFHFSRVTWVTGLGLPSLAFRADDGVDLGLGELRDGGGNGARHWGGEIGVRVRHDGQGVFSVYINTSGAEVYPTCLIASLIQIHGHEYTANPIGRVEVGSAG